MTAAYCTCPNLNGWLCAVAQRLTRNITCPCKCHDTASPATPPPPIFVAISPETFDQLNRLSDQCTAEQTFNEEKWQQGLRDLGLPVDQMLHHTTHLIIDDGEPGFLLPEIRKRTGTTP